MMWYWNPIIFILSGTLNDDVSDRAILYCSFNSEVFMIAKLKEYLEYKWYVVAFVFGMMVGHVVFGVY